MAGPNSRSWRRKSRTERNGSPDRRSAPRKARAISDTPPQMSASVSSEAVQSILDTATVARLATGLWRLNNKLATSSNLEPPLHGIRREVTAMCDALTDAGIEVQSHDGSTFDAGLSLIVVAFQPSDSLTRDEVLETIKPTVYLNRQVIQQGQVIVGTPTAPLYNPVPPDTNSPMNDYADDSAADKPSH
jgi:hypothetical protein